jgi:hypothetical protein
MTTPAVPHYIHSGDAPDRRLSAVKTAGERRRIDHGTAGRDNLAATWRRYCTVLLHIY